MTSCGGTEIRVVYLYCILMLLEAKSAFADEKLKADFLNLIFFVGYKLLSNPCTGLKFKFFQNKLIQSLKIKQKGLIWVFEPILNLDF